MVCVLISTQPLGLLDKWKAGVVMKQYDGVQSGNPMVYLQLEQ